MPREAAGQYRDFAVVLFVHSLLVLKLVCNTEELSPQEVEGIYKRDEREFY